MNENNNVNNDINEDVTREINLDELYDGSINNTVIIDPITKNEVLIKDKKRDFKFVFIFLAIFALLGLYYINNHTDLFENKKTNKKDNIITTTKEVIKKDEKGIIKCEYNLKSDNEDIKATYDINYLNTKVIDGKFNLVAVSNTDSITDTITDLLNQYETLYINNSTLVNNNFSFIKNEVGFTFNANLKFDDEEVNSIMVEDGKTILFNKPIMEEDKETLYDKLVQKGFTCSYKDGLDEE